VLQKSAEVIVPILHGQWRREGPNDEEGGAIGELVAREPRFHGGDHRFIIPTGTDRDGAHREASLESIL
jgi:hypothetical protein